MTEGLNLELEFGYIENRVFYSSVFIHSWMYQWIILSRIKIGLRDKVMGR